METLTEELHVWLTAPEGIDCHITYKDTLNAIEREERVINTTLTHFLCFDYAKRLFVHINDEVHEITLGDCEGTERLIREAHNLEKMLIAGEFDWF